MNSKFCIAIVVLSVCALSLAAPQFPQDQQAQSGQQFQQDQQVQERFQSQPQQDQSLVQLVRSTNNNDGSGNYLYTIELDNGHIQSEAGKLKTVGDHDVVVVVGQYSFVGPDGITYWVNYTADENGFHPVVGTGPGGIQGGGDAQEIDPNALKSLIG